MFIPLFLAAVCGCGTSKLTTWQCEQWSCQGTVVADPASDYMTKLVSTQCGCKCRCYKKREETQFYCEYGEPHDCFEKCAKDWDLVCTKWRDVPITVDFITRERVE